MNFNARLEKGQVAESLIANWLRSRGWYVLPIYEKEGESNKGPRLFTPQKTLIGTDMFIFRGDQRRWIEAKHKSAFTWYRNGQRFTTGIDFHHYLHYCQIDDLTPWPVWLLFLHRDGRARDTPPDKESPTGLFGNTLAYLREHESHTSENWGTHGMVYWAERDLRRLATLEEVLSLEENAIPF